MVVDDDDDEEATPQVVCGLCISRGRYDEQAESEAGDAKGAAAASDTTPHRGPPKIHIGPAAQHAPSSTAVAPPASILTGRSSRLCSWSMLRAPVVA